MNDGFKEVKYKKRARPNKNNSKFSKKLASTLLDQDTLKKRVLESQLNLQSSKFVTSLLKKIGEDVTGIEEILCYGLGNFSESYIARTQLAALLCLKDHYKAKVWISDPAFLLIEESLLLNFDLEVITANEEAKRTVTPNRSTLVFFPHCPKQLVNNFLWANWGTTLYNCIILSNSFNSVIERNTSSDLDRVSCIKDIVAICKETSVCDSDEFFDVFNDLALHKFIKALEPSPKFWNPRKEPQYLEDIEFITKKVATVINLS